MHSILHWIDSTIVIVSVLLAVVCGVWFSRKQKSTDAYYAASGNIPAWAVGMSMFATIISSVTFLAYPGYAYGGDWVLLVQGLMLPIVLVGAIGFIVPLYRKVIKLSTYEYFERRFGSFARYYISLAFLVEHFAKMAAIIYLMASATEVFAGGLVDAQTIVVAIGVAVILLTYLGGMEAIIWMDVVQGFLLVLGGVVAIVVLLTSIDGGLATVVHESSEHNLINLGTDRWNLVETTFLVMVLNGFFFALQKYGTDQSLVQRYLAARSDKEAERATFVGVGLSVPAWALFMFVGTCLLVFYQQNPELLPEGIANDKVFPEFIKTQMPVGITGLIVAALVAGGISSVDSDVNCISAVIVEDYYGRIRKNATDRQKLRVGKVAVLVVGVLAVYIATLYLRWGGQSLLGSLFAIYAIFSAGIVGVLILGLFSRRANNRGLMVGIAASVLFTAYAVLTSTEFDMGNGKQLLLDLGSWNFPHSTYMLGVYSHLIVLIVGYIASLFFKTPLADKALTVYGYKR
ncbi:MAG: sodium:solute symporter [Bacteroidaceae bacterium]|nr:sodium:solute symporter [Bacteroidaceae bacterium]